jgi:protein-tyrosine phosphatase
MCTPEDLVAFDALRVRTIFDLRSDSELAEAPGPRVHVQLTVPSRQPWDGDPTSLSDRRAGEQWLFEDYCTMVQSGGPSFGALFTELAQEAVQPAVFHCWVGKDRTGMAAALLLSALGVDREAVLDDYELTTTLGFQDAQRAVVDLFVDRGIPRAGAEGMLSTPRWAMADALAMLDEDYESLDFYLCGAAGNVAGILGSAPPSTSRLNPHRLDPRPA